MASSQKSQKVYTKQSSFTGGEVSPDMWGRDDFEKYSSSCKTMLNFYPHLSGGASNRPGTQFIAEVKDSSKKVKLLPFQFSVEQAYIIEAGNEYFRYYKDGGQIVSGITPVETATVYPESVLFDLKIAQSADTMYICNINYPPKTLTRNSHTSWTYANFPFKNGPFRTQNSDSLVTVTPSSTYAAISITSSINIFTSDMVGSFFQISHPVINQTYGVEWSTIGVNTSNTLICKGNWSLTTTGDWDGVLYLQKSTDNGVTWSNVRTYRPAAQGSYNYQDNGTIDDLTFLRVVYDRTGGDSGLGLSFYCDPFIYDGVVKITSVTSGTLANGDVVGSDNYNIGLASTAATNTWADGSWSTKNGWPACVKFYQNRLVFAGTKTEPLTLWMSQVGDYPNFLVNTIVKDDDAIDAPLVSQGVNAIQSMISLGNLIAFTAGGEWKVGTGSESTALTPKTIRALQQGYRGSSKLEPLIAGNKILYCQEMGSVVRDLSFSLNDDAYVGDDLTVLASHLFRNHDLVDWAFQQEPDGIIWAVRDDGVLLSFTYLKEQKVWAWARHTTDGEFESVATIPGSDYTEVWFVVKREINGATKRYIERMIPRMVSTNPKEQLFVDCAISYNNPIAITGVTRANPVVITAASHGFSNGNYIDISDIKGMTELNGYRYKVASVTTNTFALTNMDDNSNINGTAYTAYKSGGYVRKAVNVVSNLTHLEGKEVSILADGSVHSKRTITGSSITLDDYASVINVGLGYTCDLETLNIDFPMKDGTIQGRPKAIKGVTIRTENSVGGKVAISSSMDNNGDYTFEPLEYSLSNTWAKPTPLFTGDIRLYPYSDFTTDATVLIRQSDPLPLSVLAIMTQLEIGGGD